MYTSWSKLYKELKNGIAILVDKDVLLINQNSLWPIEGLHDAARTSTRTIFQNLLFSVYTARYREKRQKSLELSIYFIEGFEISSECVCWCSCHSVVIW